MAVTLIFIFGRGSARREISFYLFGREIISCLSRANVRALHEIPDRIHTELTLILLTLKVHILFKSAALFKASPTNSVDPDQTASVRRV